VTGTELVPRQRAVVLPPGLGPAAQRFARTSLRKSAQTQRTYASTYARFAAWLAEYTKTADAPLAAFTADALAAYLDELEQDRAPATVEKERAALNRLARYLHTLGTIDATEILMVETAGASDKTPARAALDAETYARVKTLARARLVRSASMRTAPATAARDHALILVLGDMGLRSHEARSLLTSSIAARRSDGLRPWLTVIGKGDKIRKLPIPTDVDAALLRWERERPPELSATSCCSSGASSDGRYPDAGVSCRVRRCLTSSSRSCPPPASRPRSHTHVLRHTYGNVFMRNGGDLQAPGTDGSRLERDDQPLRPPHTRRPRGRRGGQRDRPQPARSARRPPPPARCLAPTGALARQRHVRGQRYLRSRVVP
jgi:site-specific recombinase XerD